MAKKLIATSDDFARAVAAFQQAHGFKTWQAALLHLAAVGLAQATEKPVPAAYQAWGGKREKKQNRPD